MDVPVAFHHQLRMHPPKCLDDVAVPANRLILGKDFEDFFRLELLPLRCPSVWAQERRRMVKMLHPSKWFVTEKALLTLIPVGNDIPEQAILGIGLNLLQAFLAAVLALRPAGASVEPQAGITPKHSSCRSPGRHFHGCLLMGFRASNDSFSSICKVRLQRRKQVEHGNSTYNRHDCNRKKNKCGHVLPPANCLIPEASTLFYSVMIVVGARKKRRVFRH